MGPGLGSETDYPPGEPRVERSNHLCWVVGCFYYRGVGGVKRGQRILLRHHKSNCHDQNAVAAISASGDMLGHLRRPDAAFIAPKLDRGNTASAIIDHITAIPPRFRVSIELVGYRTKALP